MICYWIHTTTSLLSSVPLSLPLLPVLKSVLMTSWRLIMKLIILLQKMKLRMFCIKSKVYLFLFHSYSLEEEDSSIQYLVRFESIGLQRCTCLWKAQLSLLLFCFYNQTTHLFCWPMTITKTSKENDSCNHIESNDCLFGYIFIWNLLFHVHKDLSLLFILI